MFLTRIVLACLAFLAALSARGAQDIVPLTIGTNSCSVILYPRDCALSARSAKKLADYLKLHTAVDVPLIADDAFKTPGSNTTIVIIDGTTDHRVAAKFRQPVSIGSDRQDAYVLKVVQPTGSSPLIVAAGKGPAGAKYAAYQLMRELEIAGAESRVRLLDVKAEPFIKTRSVALFNVWGMPIDLTRRHNTESWPVEELERYLDMYDFFGFNAIESHDRFNDNYLRPLFGLERAEWRDKVLAMSEHARRNGQEFFLRIWGHSAMETPKLARELGPNASVPKRLVEFCVNDPEGRKRWEDEILRYYLTNYAGKIDSLIGHWCDPGICRKNGCDYKTPLKLQMELHRAFKAVDPKFTSAFSLWFFDVTKNNPAGWAHGGWAGYDNDFDLINAGILDREVTIATATTQPNSYNDDVVKATIAAGHKPAVWTWYRADHEIRPSLHVHLHERLGEYFSDLPASAKQLEWHNIERNVHKAANTANYYVAAGLMWDPSRNVDELLKEFLTLAFGSENASKVMPAYLALEKIRCHSCYKNWESARFTGLGTPHPQSDRKTAEAALSALSNVRFQTGFRPRILLDVSPEQMLTDLTASLEVTRDFAICREKELPALDRAREKGDRETVLKLLEELEVKYKPWSLTLAGRQEWSILDQKIKQSRQQVSAIKPRE